MLPVVGVTKIVGMARVTLLGVVATFTGAAPGLVKTISPAYVPTAPPVSRIYTVTPLMVPPVPIGTVTVGEKVALSKLTSYPAGGLTKTPSVSLTPDTSKLADGEGVPTVVVSSPGVPSALIVGGTGNMVMVNVTGKPLQPVPVVIPICVGKGPTGITSPAVSVAVLITVTVLSAELVTYN
jgi:hypothetical protein